VSWSLYGVPVDSLSACALAMLAGPQLVFDVSATAAFVVRPGEKTEDLGEDWPW
jgi:hypothetical protein